MRIDLHVHSKFSMRPSQWILKKIGCPESFTEPVDLYRIAQKKGMTHFTITDHNSIEGALEIAHLPGTFISEEITTYFPDNGCKIHVLALDITERQHEDIQKVRPNIFELVQYLNDAPIFHIVAHPLYAINDRLSLNHFEKLLVLFKHFELNGSRNPRENETLKRVITQMDGDTISRLSRKHGIIPQYSRPGQKILFGGSDDHSSLNIARTHTVFDQDGTIQSAFKSTDPSSVSVVSNPASPLTMAHNLYGIAYQFYLSKSHLTRYNGKDILLGFLDQALCPEGEEGTRAFNTVAMDGDSAAKASADAFLSGPLMDILRREALGLFHDHQGLFLSDVQESREKRWFDVVNAISNRVMLHFGNHLLDHVAGVNVFSIFHTIGTAGGFYSLLAPYFVAYSQFSQDRSLSQQVNREWPGKAHGQANDSALHLAHFTDTFNDINGVALTLRQNLAMAKKNGKHLTLVTCDPSQESLDPNIRNFKPTGAYSLPEYQEQKLFLPPFLEILNFCYDQGFNQIHSSTPGPIGLAALAIAKILNIPISGTYHTQFPQYAGTLTGDSMIEGLTWKYILWYYGQLDIIYAPSQSTLNELAARGIPREKLRTYPRGIDIHGFNPQRKKRLEPHIEREGKTIFLYVGRVSREKNLPHLERAFFLLAGKRPDVSLVIAGDGPYLDDMKESMRGLPVTFTGYLQGDALKDLYVSCDVFVFPSATDTFGNVVLEAQASGLPVIVTDQGGPYENMIPEKTGYVVKAGDTESLLTAMEEFANSDKMVLRMGDAARSYMENRSFEEAFLKTWTLYKELNGSCDGCPEHPEGTLAHAV